MDHHGDRLPGQQPGHTKCKPQWPICVHKAALTGICRDLGIARGGEPGVERVLDCQVQGVAMHRHSTVGVARKKTRGGCIMSTLAKIVPYPVSTKHL